MLRAHRYKKLMVPAALAVVIASLLSLQDTPVRAAGTYTVPSSIQASCASDVSAAFNSWLASVPDDSSIMFPANACYGIDSTLNLPNRNGLTINGNGGQVKLLTSTANSTSHLSIWNVNGGSNISFQNLTLVGDNTATSNDGNDAACNPSGPLEWQYGIDFAGTQTGSLSSVNVTNTCGDFVEAEPYINASGNDVWAHPATNISISGGTFSVSGRQGFGITDAQTVVISGVNMSSVAQSAIDIETDVTQEYASNITIENSSFRDIANSIVSNYGQGGNPNVGTITVSNNSETNTISCSPLIWAGTPTNLSARQNYVISGNNFAPYALLAEFDSNIDNVTISNNTDSGAYGNGGCGYSEALIFDNVHGVTVTGNNFGPTVTQLSQMSGTTGVSACGNRYGQIKVFDLPVGCTANGTPPVLTTPTPPTSTTTTTAPASSSSTTTAPNSSSSSPPNSSSSPSGSVSTPTTVTVSSGSQPISLTPPDLDVSTTASVRYFVDSKLIADVTKPPFAYTFSASSLSPGCHSITTTIEYKNGTSSTSKRQLCLAAAHGQSSSDTFYGIVVGCVVVAVIAVIGRRTWRPHKERLFFKKPEAMSTQPPPLFTVQAEKLAPGTLIQPSTRVAPMEAPREPPAMSRNIGR